MSGSGLPSADDGIYLTTDPKSIFSVNMLFNLAVWGVAGGYIGSLISLPTPEGIYSLTGPGAAVGVGSYGLLVLSKQGPAKWFKDWEDFLAREGSETQPIDQGKATAFYRKYGVDFWTAKNQYHALHPDVHEPKPYYNEFIAWCDQYYLKEDPNFPLTDWGLTVGPKVWLDKGTIEYFNGKFGITLDQATKYYFENTGTTNFVKLFNIPGVGYTPYVADTDWKKFLVWIYHSPWVLHTRDIQQ